MKSQNGGSPSKAKTAADAISEISAMNAAETFERRRIPYFITSRLFTSEPPPKESARTPK